MSDSYSADDLGLTPEELDKLERAFDRFTEEEAALLLRVRDASDEARKQFKERTLRCLRERGSN